METLVRILVLFMLLQFVITGSVSKCPKECICDLDDSGRYFTNCQNATFKQIPDIDLKMEIIVIQKPAYTLTIGPIFLAFKKLEVLRINNAFIPAIGSRSFWGVKSLKVLDLSQNNITQINADNFYDQSNLLELDLSTNKVERIPSGSFSYLKVKSIFIDVYWMSNWKNWFNFRI